MKRRILTILLFVLAGAVVNIAVAWGCATWVSVAPGKRTMEGWHNVQGVERKKGWDLTRWDAFGSTRIVVMIRSKRRSGANLSRREIMPWWCALPEVMDRQVSEVKSDVANGIRAPRGGPACPTVIYADARGWPLPALRCRWDHGISTRPVKAEEVLAGGLLMPPRQPDTGNTVAIHNQRALPYRPVWPGFLANSVLFASMLFLITFGRQALRSRIRRRRGRCIRCGYDLRGDFENGCPECGWKREEASDE